MKKVAVTMALALALGFALAGCGSQASSSSASASSESASSASAAASTTSATSASASSSSASAVAWTKASSAADAAKGAGVGEFVVPQVGTKLSIGDLTKWEFCYAKDMAEADGGAAAATIVIRKGVGSGDNTAELSGTTSAWSDLANMTYSKEWEVDVNGTKVRCYGNADGKAMKAVWSDGKNSYSILALGQGDTWKEFGLPDDDIAILVKGTKKAESTTENKTQTQSTTSSNNGSSSEQPGFNVENAVWTLGLGEFLRYYAVEGEDGETYWAVVTRGSDGNEYTTYMDDNGNVTKDMEVGDAPDFDGNPGFNVENAVWNNGLGELISCYPVEGEDGETYWAVTTRGSDGNEYVTYMDNNGNVTGDMEVGDVADDDSAADDDATDDTDEEEENDNENENEE